MTLHLFGLPGELLLKVFKQLDFRALRVLARTSVYTNAIAIPILIDMSCPEIQTEGSCRITSISEYTTYPFRLAFSLPEIPLKALEVNVVTSHYNLIKGLQGITDILARVAPGIEKARISFAVSQWGRAERTKQGVERYVWTKEISSILGMLVERGCKTIEVDGFHDDLRLVKGIENYFVHTWKGAVSRRLSSGGDDINDTPRIPRARNPPAKASVHSTAHLPKDGDIGVAGPNLPLKPSKGCGSTQEVALYHCDCLFQTFILGRTLSFVNSLSHTLRSLTMESRTLSTEDWHQVLTTVSLPRLSSCQFAARRTDQFDILHSASKSIDSIDVFSFLGRHRTITTFRFFREVSEEARYRPLNLPVRRKLDRSEPLLPGLEELSGSVRFVSELFQWNREATPRYEAVLPSLHTLNIESGFLLKGTAETHTTNMQQCLGLIHDINNSGGLQSLTRLGIDSCTYAATGSFTLLDLLFVDPSLTSIHSSTDTQVVRPLSFIRDVTLASSEWKNKASFDYADDETRTIFRGFEILFPIATDLRFGSLKTGVWGSLKKEAMRDEIARACPSLKRIHLGWTASGTSDAVVNLDQYRRA